MTEKSKTGPKPSVRIELDIATPPQFETLDEWRRVQAEWLALQVLAPLPAGRIVAIKIAAGAPEQSRSAHLIVDPIIELVKARGIVNSDASIASVVAGWHRSIAAGHCRVTLWTTTNPARRQTASGRRRIGAATSARMQAQQVGA
jgi:hypothetical protein